MRIGLIVNPVAGMGGPVGLKGTDDLVFLAAMLLGAEKGSAHAIARRALSSMRRDVEFVSVEDMGSDVLDELGIEHEKIPLKADSFLNTDKDDTISSAKKMEMDCDLQHYLLMPYPQFVQNVAPHIFHGDEFDVPAHRGQRSARDRVRRSLLGAQ